ncbi:MAG: cysteine--tRNA ligase [Candidatus Limnocylindrales bacterium]
MTLQLRNTLSRQVEPVAPIEPGGPVRIYTCGPTVYRYAHVGNLRTFLLADLIRRVILYHGVPVLHVKNITDVGHMRDERLDTGGDRMLVQAELEGRSPSQIADYYEAAFHADEALLNILPAHRFPRATEHIAEMVELAEQLQDAGLAYMAPDGTLYFDVSGDPLYGRLSRNSLLELRAGHRATVEAGKRDAADFALWKRAEAGRIVKWSTDRWGEGFPGWHLECSAMSRRYLGDEFELHTGGVDNVFPHHEDEIAQSLGATGTIPARHWAHGEFLLMDGHKMAKSAGNLQRVTDVVEGGIDPLAFRYLALTARYRHRLEYSDASLASAAAGLTSLRSALQGLAPPAPEGPWAAPAVLHASVASDRPVGLVDHASGHGSEGAAAFDLRDRAHTREPALSPAGQALHDRFVSAVDGDLDMPRALGVVRAMVRAGLTDDERRWLVLDADMILGLDLHRVWQPPVDQRRLPDGAAALLHERALARQRADYARADELREALRAMEVEPIDGTDGEPAWRPTSG